MKKRSFGPTPEFTMVENYVRRNNDFVFIAGSCSVESEKLIYDTAAFVKSCGATHLRGGVFRAGTYPKNKSSFGWISEEMIKAFHDAAIKNGLENIIEVLDYEERSMDMISNYCTAFQVGARAMQNYSLLRILGTYGKPVFLKRSVGATVDEWLGAAEHLLIGGVKDLFLIERGSSTFHNDVRWTPCLHVVPSVKSITKIPVIVDPSHSTGNREFVTSMAIAGIAAGADGLLVETHPRPDQSLSDAEQALDWNSFKNLTRKVNKIRFALSEEGSF